MRERLISAAVGLALLFIWLFFFQTIALNIVLSLLAVLLVYEVLSASKNTGNIFIMLLSFVYAALIPMLTDPALEGIRTLATYLYIVLLFLILLLRHKDMHFEHLAFTAFASVAIPNALAFAVQIRAAYPTDGVFYFLLALAGAWLTDSSSFFVGTLLGKTRLAPEISPKKTVEGFFGGLAGSIVLCTALIFGYAYVCNLKGAQMDISYWQAALFGLTAALLSVLGDLSASLVKRQCAVKDFGNIMPGHGGALDRFDSVLFVLPYTYLFLSYFPIIFRGV